MGNNIDMKIENYRTAPGIQFSSFIAINRHLDPKIFTESKLLSLLIYIAMRVKRNNNDGTNSWEGIPLNVGEFVIGRISAVANTDLTEAEYRSRFLRLQTMTIIEIVKITNKYTIGKWLGNDFIDLNLEYDMRQQNDQQTSGQLTTNNNINNTNNLISLINLFFRKYISDNDVHTKGQYEYLIKEYMSCKGLELKGKEVTDCLFVIKEMLKSERTPDQIVDFMKWLKRYEKNEEQPWIRAWTIQTVQKKLPEYLAGKLKYIHSWEDEYPAYE